MQALMHVCYIYTCIILILVCGIIRLKKQYEYLISTSNFGLTAVGAEGVAPVHLICSILKQWTAVQLEAEAFVKCKCKISTSKYKSYCRK